jgi:hypothetical protein
MYAWAGLSRSPIGVRSFDPSFIVGRRARADERGKFLESWDRPGPDGRTGQDRTGQDRITNILEIRDRVRSQLSEDRTPHVREATIDVVALLASEGELATKELQNRLYEDYADDYSSARTFWNSISRYVEQVDGIEHPYGSWKYAPE